MSNEKRWGGCLVRVEHLSSESSLTLGKRPLEVAQQLENLTWESKDHHLFQL